MSVSLSRLSDIETKEIVPSIFKLYGLAATYRVDLLEILKLYGVDPEKVADDSNVVEIRRTHLATSVSAIRCATIPIRLDPGFQFSKTAAIARFVQQWGVVPMSQLKEFSNRAFSYGYIGLDDWTMYPLLVPGSFVQIDEERNRVEEGVWPSEFARPIYFIETRDGFLCSWCEIVGNNLVVTPHPMSAAKTRYLRMGSEAEVIGQVVGIAMRLDAWATPSQATSKAF
jgi:transcriptional regulator with XRE-family HTH domain